MRAHPHFLLLCLLLLISGCANESNVYFQQKRCEDKYKAFPEVVTCLKAAVDSGVVNESGSVVDLRKLITGRKGERSPKLQLYLLRAEQLSLQVQKGEISDLDGRVALQKLYVELNREVHVPPTHQGGATPPGGGMNILCKDAISRGDRGAIFVHCN